MMARHAIHLLIRQQPLRAQVVQENNPKNRKPVDPPPIIELRYDNERDDIRNQQWMVSPSTFMMVTLIDGKDGEEQVPGRYLIGQTVSSLHRLKDINNKDAGFFVFGDISARKTGVFRLRFSLFDTMKEMEEVVYMAHIDSEPFQVLPPREFGSMSESTALTRAFSEQGVKLRVRKDNRTVSSVGTKRAYNASPDSSSPSFHPSVYGGAVQDHYGTATPSAKRQRAESDFSQHHLYQNLSMTENPMAQYSANTIPSSTRHWASDDQQHRLPNQYNQLSPVTMNPNHRVQVMQMHGAANWQNMQQPTALPSPSPSVGHQHPSYSSVSSQQSSSVFGDPGSANHIPRHIYSSSYPYPTQQQPYSTPTAGDVSNPYPDLQMPVTTLADTSGLAAGQNHNYGASHGYLQTGTGSVFGSEQGELSTAYSFLGDGQQ